MLETISPYQLLQASRPKSPPRSSAAVQSAPSDSAYIPQPSSSGLPSSIPQAAEPFTKAPAYEPAKRTHYISDIHSRHSAAQRYLPS